MIALLRGRAVHREDGRAIIDVQGVGYEVLAPNRAIESWGGEEVTVHVKTEVREDAITLYGFASAVDRAAFNVLTTVQGIGPKTALACLDTLSLVDLAGAVERGDEKTLCRVPGIGKKGAQRMALELKGKLPAAGFVAPTGGAASLPPPAPADDTLVLALEKLGYTRAEIDSTVRKLVEKGITDATPVGERLRAALAVLYRGDR